jgi:hypothetical protein
LFSFVGGTKAVTYIQKNETKMLVPFLILKTPVQCASPLKMMQLLIRFETMKLRMSSRSVLKEDQESPNIVFSVNGTVVTKNYYPSSHSNIYYARLDVFFWQKCCPSKRIQVVALLSLFLSSHFWIEGQHFAIYVVNIYDINSIKMNMKIREQCTHTRNTILVFWVRRSQSFKSRNCSVPNIVFCVLSRYKPNKKNHSFSQYPRFDNEMNPSNWER